MQVNVSIKGDDSGFHDLDNVRMRRDDEIAALSVNSLKDGETVARAKAIAAKFKEKFQLRGEVEVSEYDDGGAYVIVRNGEPSPDASYWEDKFDL